jgi:hypothetical protein
VSIADPHEPAKAEHRVADLAAALFQHDALNRADVLALAVEYPGALDLVRPNQVMGFLGINVLLLSHGCAPWLENKRATHQPEPCSAWGNPSPSSALHLAGEQDAPLPGISAWSLWHVAGMRRNAPIKGEE